MKGNKLQVRGDNMETLLQLAKIFLYITVGSGIFFLGVGIAAKMTGDD